MDITGTLMSRDRIIATVENGRITDRDSTLIPFYLKSAEYIDGWLASRTIDGHRVNSRLLKRALRLSAADDPHVALRYNAAKITDTYWFKPLGSSLCYEDVRFKKNDFDSLALRGDPAGFSREPSRTPELTNTGSFEKCWRLINGDWYLYKNENDNERFSELFICALGEKLGLNMAHYETDDGYIRTKDFTNGAKVNYEPISGLAGDNDDYEYCFNILYDLSPVVAERYLEILWLDTICFNMDRHTENFGLLRNVTTGEVTGMAPNFDNNIALISRGYPPDVARTSDGLIKLFREFLQNCASAKNLAEKMWFPRITVGILNDVLQNIPISADKIYVRDFVMNGYNAVREIISPRKTREYSHEER